MWTRIEVLRRAAIGPGLFSDDPKKTFPFAESFDVLGTKLTVGELHGGPFTIENKPKRLEKISQLLNDLVKSGKITKRQAQVVQGNLNFATSLVMGRSLKVASRAFASITAGEGDVSASELGDPLCLDSKASRWAARPPDRSSRPEAGLVFASLRSRRGHLGDRSYSPGPSEQTLDCPGWAALVDKWLQASDHPGRGLRRPLQGWPSTTPLRAAGPSSSWIMKAPASP